MSRDANESLKQMFREESRERLDRVVETLLAFERGEEPREGINLILRDLHSVKGAAGMLGLDAAGAIAHAMEDVLADARESGTLDPVRVGPLLRACDALSAAANGDPADPRQVSAELVGGTTSTAKSPQMEGPEAPEPADAERVSRQTRALHVDARQLDRIVDTLGEAVVQHRSLDGLVRQATPPDPNELDEVLHRTELRLDDLQHSVIGLRTEPLSTISDALPRLVRDLAAAAGKEVDLEMAGVDTRLDRVVLEGASEAISHLVRNAIAHGIESPEEREAIGKPRRGRIELRAQQVGDRVAVAVVDDGRGVAADLVANARDQAELMQILAAPGLSRADGATELSGRGVGLDAVLEHVRRIGGEVQVETEAGRGATFRLLLPISLALLQILIARRGEVLFGIPISSVLEVAEAREPLKLRGRMSIEIRGEVLPLADPIAVLGGAVGPLEDRSSAIVAAAAGARAALACDELLGDEEVLVKPLGPALSGVPGYLGAAVVAGGRIVLVLDPTHVVSAAQKGGASEMPAREVGPTAAATDRRRILVVDDQFTAREIQRSIFEAAGFDVVTARDGREAWEVLASGERVELVLTDVEMPEIDGLELARKIRADPARSSLPVVLVTSRGSDADERRGLEAGADAYVVKQRFDQRALLDTINRLIAE